jgi:hypothetical protein
MAYTYRIFDSIADASNEDWERCFRAIMKPIVYKHRKIVLKPVPGSGRINARIAVLASPASFA